MEQETTVEIVGDEESTARKRRRSEPGASESAVLRIVVPEATAARVRELITELKSRGVELRADEILRIHLDKVPDEYWEAETISRTPQEYYIRAALEIPDFKERLVRQAIKALNRTQGPEAAPRRRRRAPTTENSMTATPEGNA